MRYTHLCVIGLVGVLCAMVHAQNKRPNILWSHIGLGHSSFNSAERLVASPSGNYLATLHRGIQTDQTAVSVFTFDPENSTYIHRTTIWSGATLGSRDALSAYNGSPVTFLEDERYIVEVHLNRLRLLDVQTYRRLNETVLSGNPVPYYYAVASRPRSRPDEPLYIAAVGELSNFSGGVLDIYEVDPASSQPFTLIASASLGVGAGVCVGWSLSGTLNLPTPDILVTASDSGMISVWNLNGSTLSLINTQYIPEAPTALSVRRYTSSIDYVVGTERGGLIDQSGTTWRDFFERPIIDIERSPSGTHLLALTGTYDYPYYTQSSLFWLKRDGLRKVGQTQGITTCQDAYFYLHEYLALPFWLDAVVLPSGVALALIRSNNSINLPHLVQLSAPESAWESTIASDVDGRAVAISGKTVAVSAGRSVRIYELQDGDSLTFSVERTLDYGDALVNDIALGGSILAVALNDGRVEVRNLLSDESQTLNFNEGAYCLDLSLNDVNRASPILLAVGTAREAHIYRGGIGSLALQRTLPIPHGEATRMYVCDIAFHPREPQIVAMLATGRAENPPQLTQLSAWRLDQPNALWQRNDAYSWVRVPSAYQIAFVGQDYEYIVGNAWRVQDPYLPYEIELIRVSNGQSVLFAAQGGLHYIFRPHPVSRCEVSPQHLVLGCSVGNHGTSTDIPVLMGIRFDWEKQSAWISHWQWGHHNGITAVSSGWIDRGSPFVCSVAPDGQLRVWAWNRGAVESLYRGTDFVQALGIGRSFVSGSYLQGVNGLMSHLYDRATGQPWQTFSLKTSQHFVLPTPDGMHIISLRDRIYPAYNPGAPLFTPTGVTIIDPIGNAQISQHNDNLARIWTIDVAEGTVMIDDVRTASATCFRFLSYSLAPLSVGTLQTITDPNGRSYCTWWGTPSAPYKTKNIALDPTGQWAVFVGGRELPQGNTRVWRPLISLFRKTGSWLPDSEWVGESGEAFPYTVLFLPRPGGDPNLPPYVLVGDQNGTVHLRDPANDWAILRTLNLYRPSGSPGPHCYAVAYRSGIVAVGGTYSLEFYKYDPNTGNLSERPFRLYDLETAPGVLQIALGELQDNRMEYAYTQFTGGVAYAQLDICGCPDINFDGIVDDVDLLTALFNFGSTGANLYSDGDVNCDEIIDDADLLLILFAFGDSC